MDKSIFPPQVKAGILQSLPTHIAYKIKQADEGGSRFTWFEGMSEEDKQTLYNAGFEVRLFMQRDDPRQNVKVIW